MGHDGLLGYNPQGHGLDGGHAALEHIASTAAQAYIPRRRPETRTTNDNICTSGTLVFSRLHTSTRDRSEHSGRMVGSYDPFGNVVVISYRPQGSDPSDNFVCVDGKFKLPTRFVEPKWRWAAPACDLQARSPSLIKQALDAFLPDGWTLVV